MKREIEKAMTWGLNHKEASLLARLCTPALVQDYVAQIPANYEVGGETCLPVAQVLRQNRAHCIEGAFVAACALWMQGRRPLLLDLKARCDDSDHVVALFQQGRYWGAISKSNHVWLRWRDPVYRSVRELALSYFHEYTMGSTKTLVAYSAPFDLRRIDPSIWIGGSESCWDLIDVLDGSRHTPLFAKAQLRHIKPRDAMEMKAHQIVEHPHPEKRK